MWDSLKVLLPYLLSFGEALFKLFKGDINEIKRNIEDRTAEIEALRAQRDAQLDAKFGADED